MLLRNKLSRNMSDYYEVQAAESRPAAAACFTPPILKSCCLSETIEATKASSASERRLSQSCLVSRSLSSGRGRGRTHDD